MLDSVGGPSSGSLTDTALGGGVDGSNGDTYKVLVLDRPCRDVVSPLVRVADLRKHGVTLHLALEADRQAIKEVAAVYLVSPTDAVVKRIGKDLTAGLYASWHLHFASPLPTPGLQALAGEAVRAEGGAGAAAVARVCDQCLGFVTLEQRLFSLGLPRAFVQLNDPGANDKDIEALVGDIVTGLFCVCATLGCVPILRCPRGGAAQSVAQQLDARLRDHLAQRTGLLTSAGDGGGGAAGAPRPVLVLLDRSFDVTTPVQHVWTYQPMCADLLGMRLNRVTVPGTPGGAPGGGSAQGSARKSYDVDPEADPFWAAHAGSQFPKVAEEVEAELQKYKASVAAVNRATEAAATAGDRLDASGSADAHLMSAVSSLPELTERKKLIDKHTSIATALLGAIKARSLDAFCVTEEDILSGRPDKAAIAALLTGAGGGGGKGTAEDRLRLAIVATLAADAAPSSADADATDTALRAAGGDVAALAYVRSLRAFNLTGSTTGGGASGGGGGAASAGLAALGGASQGNLLDWADRALGQGLNAVAKGVNRLLAAGRTLPVARVVDAILEGRPGSEADDFLVFDPKSPKPGPQPGSSLQQPGSGAGAHGQAGGAGAGVRRDVIVFVVGGGSYAEHRALQEVAQAKQPPPVGGPRTVVYGSTDLLSGPEFTAQLAELGRRMGGTQ